MLNIKFTISICCSNYRIPLRKFSPFFFTIENIDKTVEEEMGLGRGGRNRIPVKVILQFYRLVLSGQLLRRKK